MKQKNLPLEIPSSQELRQELNRDNEEVAFTFEKKKYPNKPSGDLRKAVENILKKVTSVEIEDGIVIKDTSTFEEKVMADINKEKK